jgi:hypothetical protein
MVQRKIVPEPVKNAAKTVARAISDKIVDGIEIGRMFAFPSFPLLVSPFSPHRHFPNPLM